MQNCLPPFKKNGDNFCVSEGFKLLLKFSTDL